MPFVDLLTLTAFGGHGGAGSASFNRKKFQPHGGPDGGDGGCGGSVILRAKSSLSSLMDLSYKRTYRAPNGQTGMGDLKYGADGKNVYLDVPCGSIIKTTTGDTLADLCENGQTFVLAKGGKGGLGNRHFASSRKQSPTYAQAGLPGDEITVCIELQLIADIGLIGCPNAGKSTLLHLLTDAKVKIANYPFTTLTPNLGILKYIDQHITLADIPGLVKGAAKGVGLGHDFLRHISRTRYLLHLIEANDDPKVCYETYELIQNELRLSPFPVSHKPQLVLITKIDTITQSALDTIQRYFANKGLCSIYFISTKDSKRLAILKAAIQKKLPST
ncbi:MAG: GTPase ObgE [bacterium]